VVVAQAFTAAAVLPAAAARLSVSVGLKPRAPPATTASRAPTVRRAQPVSRIIGIGTALVLGGAGGIGDLIEGSGGAGGNAGLLFGVNGIDGLV
jgi:hypothetical protein